MELTQQNVDDVIKDCLFTDEEMKEKGEEDLMKTAVCVEGVVRKFGFSPDKLTLHREDIRDMLSELPQSFMLNEGGGHSFLKACVKEDGTHWGEHRNMEALFALGEAMGFVQVCIPRELWKSLPGGMPYYVVDLDKA